jgi:flagellar motility protein MotE (MotC chaperone)
MYHTLKSLIYKLRILPVLIVVASLAFVVRIGDAYVGMKNISGSAYAEETKAAEKPTEKAADVSADAMQTQPSSDTLKSKDEAAKKSEGGPGDISLPSTASDGASSSEKWQDASDTDVDYSNIKKEMYQDLVKRRQEIEAKEKQMSQREALLEAAQKELDRKVKEMEGLRDEIKDLLKQQTAEEAARIQSLVKIYAGMSPKNAARIFDTLDTDVLMDVVSNMPEMKASPIIALMSPDRAKVLTTMLAEQKKLPDIP